MGEVMPHMKPSYIQSSNYFHASPLCFRWILGSWKWRISTFHPSYLLYVLALLCHCRPRVINLLSVHANRTLQSFLSSGKLVFRQLSSLLKIFTSCFHLQKRCHIQLGSTAQGRRREGGGGTGKLEKDGRQRDRLTGKSRSIIVAFRHRTGANGEGEISGVARSAE